MCRLKRQRLCQQLQEEFSCIFQVVSHIGSRRVAKSSRASYAPHPHCVSGKEEEPTPRAGVSSLNGYHYFSRRNQVNFLIWLKVWNRTQL
jgi:hypothetical protein